MLQIFWRQPPIALYELVRQYLALETSLQSRCPLIITTFKTIVLRFTSMLKALTSVQIAWEVTPGGSD